MTQKNIFLIGPQGAGKTTIGRHLAALLHRVFYDSDQEIEKQTGVSLTTIFDLEGEVGFRQREEMMIARLTQLSNIILSSGGGTIESEKNREALSTHGIVVYLQTSLEIQLSRTRYRKSTRPLLNIPNPEKKIIELHLKREPLYRSIAHYTYDTTHNHPSSIAKNIVKLLTFR